MATNAPAAAPPPSSHPLAAYLSALQSSRQILVEERIRQEGLGVDNRLSTGERAAALAEVPRLAAEIGHLDDSRDTFVVGVVTAVLPPSQALVNATAQLARDLGKVIVDANRPAVLIGIVTAYLNGAAAVATGKVPPTPAPPAPPPAPGPSPAPGP